MSLTAVANATFVAASQPVTNFQSQMNWKRNEIGQSHRSFSLLRRRGSMTTLGGWTLRMDVVVFGGGIQICSVDLVTPIDYARHASRTIIRHGI